MHRRQPIVTNQIYHVFNRGIASQPIFLKTRDYERFCNLTDFYRFSNPRLRYSYYNRLEIKQRQEFLSKLRSDGQKQIEIYSFCLMPTHFHFLIKEVENSGIQRFISNVQNGYAKYFNIRTKRSGALFQEMFKATLVETDEQFVHVARYIHLNPYSSCVVSNFDSLATYNWSSLRGYLGKDDCYSFVNNYFLDNFYANKSELRSFTFDQADYQQGLKEIAHLIKERS